MPETRDSVAARVSLRLPDQSPRQAAVGLRADDRRSREAPRAGLRRGDARDAREPRGDVSVVDADDPRHLARAARRALPRAVRSSDGHDGAVMRHAVKWAPARGCGGGYRLRSSPRRFSLAACLRIGGAAPRARRPIGLPTTRCAASLPRGPRRPTTSYGSSSTSRSTRWGRRARTSISCGRRRSP